MKLAASGSYTILRWDMELHDLAARLVPIFFGKVTVAFSIKIRTKHDLIINLITQMDWKSRDESIKPN